MEAVKAVSGKAMPLGFSDVDTDQIVASDALKRIERTGFGEFLFAEWKEDPDFVMNKPEHQGAVVLIAGENFGCGSSREHAVWAVHQAGFGAVIAPSFADIFKNNCTKNGLLTVELPGETVEALLESIRQDPEAEVKVDLEGQTVSGPGINEQFIVDASTRHRLLNGLDDVGLTLNDEDHIAKFEKSRPEYLPSVL
ncbi:3-isopropylmalate dehydratase small subunit [Rubrobacter indicoceani]|uniref:3-isopropylmalate dehydratase small subunit n=1 Tax=Rubrobacter indicoceani TaxID=2051957 RepID=UPI000E5AECEB|nr:3-isopropylmalate dehydratase small subunit [Rubrobacter indicoceani]